MRSKKPKKPFFDYRKRAGLTIDQAATLLKVDRTTIIRWEKGEPHIPVNRLDAVAKAIGATRYALRPDLYEGMEASA